MVRRCVHYEQSLLNQQYPTWDLKRSWATNSTRTGEAHQTLNATSDIGQDRHLSRSRA